MTTEEQEGARAAAVDDDDDDDVEGQRWKVALTLRGTIRSWRSRYPGVVEALGSRWMDGRGAAHE